MTYTIDTKYNNVGQSHWYQTLCKEYYAWFPDRMPKGNFKQFMAEKYPDVMFTVLGDQRFTFHFESEEHFTMFLLKLPG